MRRDWAEWPPDRVLHLASYNHWLDTLLAEHGRVPGNIIFPLSLLKPFLAGPHRILDAGEYYPHFRHPSDRAFRGIDDSWPRYIDIKVLDQHGVRQCMFYEEAA